MRPQEPPSRKPRLLVLASTYPRWRDDPEPAFVHELSKRLIHRFEVTVLCPHAPGAAMREIFDGVRVVRYRYAPTRWETLVNDGGIVSNLNRARWKLLLVPGFILAQVVTAWRMVRAGEVDVMHAHWLLPQGMVAALVARAQAGRKVPFLVTSHGADLFALRGRFARWVKAWVVGRAAIVTVVSEGMRQPMLKLGVVPASLGVEPMGVDLTGQFTPDAEAERSRDELLFVGRLVEKKGLRHLIDAMPTILAERPSAFLTVAGFGPEMEDRRDQVSRLALSDRVKFLGAVKQEDLVALYRRAAVFVAPFIEAGSGDQDGLGLVIVEAAGCGAPVVVSDMPATHALNGLSSQALVVRWSNAEELARAILSVRWSGHREQAWMAFDWNQRAAAYKRILEDVLREPR
ncbi:glycosyltransferase [Luteimonas terrae]|uniref:Glycosyltransferase family 4 protein n=1 Tax=Luteimonas terrae TaxID=1530191 RepID=A0A4V3AN89_9GAMM|nr:glycosyltransferase [Luteimonas terrae]TDK30049.1 glycosyltransferase family 4 protein [Luteimonas terrae]